MKTIKYNKLIRDKIPDIIKNSGKIPCTDILSDDDYKKMLDIKLQEEVFEYQESKEVEELADILEVIYAIAKVKGVSVKELEQVRIDKAKKRGGFSEKIVLKEVKG